MKLDRWSRRAGAAALALALAATIAACGSQTNQAATTASPLNQPTVTNASDQFGRIPDVVDKAQPSIVTVFAEGDGGQEGVGSGVIYRSDGMILTNNHVVSGATHVDVAFADGSRVAGQVTATDPDTDLAVIRVERDGLPAAHFQRALPRIGSLAVVLGSPLGFEKTVTAGIVSGLHRQIPGSASQTRALVDLIQTDAAISPGNSGGAVVDSDGRVLGISVAYVPPQQGAVAVGFAIPTATATRVANELLEHGHARHAYLGVAPGVLTPQIAGQMGVTENGVAVYTVTPDGPADRAGIRPGDVLTTVAGHKIATVEELFAALRQHEPGETVSISHVRGDQQRTAQVQVTDRPS